MFLESVARRKNILRARTPQLLLKARVREPLCPHETKSLKPAVHAGRSHFYKKKQALCLLVSPSNKIDNSITAGTEGFVQHRFHFLPVGQNESLVIELNLR
jgi:hypothetical protein